MRCLVTGAAGFIGSHLCERLLGRGHDVTGVDCFVPYYAASYKEANLAEALKHSRFRFLPLDLRTDPLAEAVADAEVVFHLAAMPGLVASWTDFGGYLGCNVVATQRLVEALKSGGGNLKRLVYGSTSSVYGRYASGDESLPTKPVSPYGVTKLAGEQLCRAYADVFGLPVVVLRYFSVYGPRQRPDMAYHKFIRALLHGEPITVYGDGQQVRGNTFVADCVAATVAAAEARPGETFNVGGGEAVSVWDVLRKIEAIADRKFEVRQEAARAGDQRHTYADTTKLNAHLGWEPQTRLDDGLRQQFEWQQRLTSVGA
jgi:nucleoside-diphosphate-sugar epimerase